MVFYFRLKHPKFLKTAIECDKTAVLTSYQTTVSLSIVCSPDIPLYHKLTSTWAAILIPCSTTCGSCILNTMHVDGKLRRLEMTRNQNYPMNWQTAAF